MKMRRFHRLAWLLGGLFLLGSFWGCNTELSRARSSVVKEDFLQAAQLYEKVVKKNPDNDDALRELTKLYCVTIKNNFKCFGKAKILFKRFQKDATVGKWYKKALYENAVDTYLSNQLQRAKRYLAKYKKMDSTNAKVLFMLANIRFRLNRKPPRNDDELKIALKEYEKAIKHSKTLEMVALSSRKQKSLLQWESNMQMASIYEFFIGDKLREFNKEQAKIAKAKAKAAAKNKKKRRRRRRRRRKEKKEKPPQFVPNAKYFAAAIAAYKAAGKFSDKHPNAFKRPLPFTKIGLFYANFKGEFEEAMKWLKIAEKWGPEDVNVVGNIKMIYDKLAEAAEEAKNKKLQKSYEKKSQQYASKFDSLKGNK